MRRMTSTSFKDPSTITLKHRKDLRPLLDVLRIRGIHYRWNFPFSLSDTHQGRATLLRVPEELEAFCAMLDILRVEAPNWFADFQTSGLRHSPERTEPMEAQEMSYRRHHAPSDVRPSPAPLAHHQYLSLYLAGHAETSKTASVNNMHDS